MGQAGVGSEGGSRFVKVVFGYLCFVVLTFWRLFLTTDRWGICLLVWLSCWECWMGSLFNVGWCCDEDVRELGVVVVGDREGLRLVCSSVSKG